MKELNKQLKTYCKKHWWNGGKKTLEFKGELKDLLKKEGISFTKRKTEIEGVYNFTFKNDYISFKVKSPINDFPLYAKQFIQMEMVRMGDKSQLYVGHFWRPTVTVNF